MKRTNAVHSAAQQNFNHFVMDIAWFGLALSATLRFSQFFALEMGATPMELGWLTALPSLICIFTVMLSGWWRGRNKTTMMAHWYPGLMYRFVFLLPALTPFFPEQWRVPWIIASAVLPAVPQGMSNAVFFMMMREAVLPHDMARLLTRRQAALNIAITLSSIGFGFLLSALPFPVNYQVMFLVAFLFSLGSQMHLGVLRPLYSAEGQATLKPVLRRSYGDLLRDRQFMAVAFLTFMVFFSYHLIVGGIPLHLEQNLKASSLFIGVFGALEVIGGVLMMVVATRWIARMGSRHVAALSLALTGGGALLMGLVHLPWAALLGNFIIGAGWAAAAVAVNTYFSEKTATEDIRASVAFHQMIYLGIFLGPILGNSLVQAGLNVTVLMIGGALARIIGGFVVYYGIEFAKQRNEQHERATQASQAPQPLA